MLVLQPLALFISIGIFVLLYGILFFSFSSYYHMHKVLRGRWNKYSLKFLEGVGREGEHSKKIIDLKIISQANDLIKEEVSQFKKTEYFLYRSGFLFYKKIYINVFFIFIVLSYAFLHFFWEISVLTSFSLSIILGIFSFYIMLRFFEKLWKEKFIRIFSQSLEIISRGLRVGLTTSHGISVVAEEMEDPVGYEFGYIAAQLRVGVPEEMALNEAAARIDIDHFRFFAVALIVQKEMGGSLTEILHKLTDVIREREKLRKKVLALSAEGRMTANVITGLPLIVYKLIDIAFPSYTDFFKVDPTGRTMTWIAVGMLLSGIVVIKRMVSIKA